MSFDYILRRAACLTRIAITIEAPTREAADLQLVERLRRLGYSPVDLLYYSIVACTERRQHI